MYLNKLSRIADYNQQIKKTNQLPIIKKAPAIKKDLHHSNSYITPVPNENNFKNYSKNTRIISHGSYGINIHTKLYRINDYLSMTNMTNKDINPLKTINSFPRTKSVSDNIGLKMKDEITQFKADTGKTYTCFYQMKKNDFSSQNSTKISNNIVNINLRNTNNNLVRSESLGIMDAKIDNVNIDNSNNNEYVIKKINNYNLKLLKNSRYFSHTKYINGPKNKNKENQRQKNKSCSTKNISIENTRSTSAARRTINDIRVEQLLSKHKIILESDIKTNFDNNEPKTAEIGVETNLDNTLQNNALFYDFIPVILQHMKQKQTLDEINKENEWIYNRINTIYENNVSRKEKFTTLRVKNGEFLFENPIIKYLFLEKTLYNLKHTVKFIDIKNKEQLDKKVLNILGEEYKNLKEKKFKFDINDFITYGYEFDPKLLVKIQPSIPKLDVQKFFNEIKSKFDKSVHKNTSTKSSVFTNRGGFFTTNKSDYKIIDKTFKSKEENTKKDKSKISSEGFLSRILRQQALKNKIRKFEGLKLREKEKNQEIDSNRGQNISNLILKETEKKNKKISVKKNNDNKVNNSNDNMNSIELPSKIDNEKYNSKNLETEKVINIIPHHLFHNDKLRQTQPHVRNSVFSTLKKQLMERNKEKRKITKREINKEKDKDKDKDKDKEKEIKEKEKNKTIQMERTIHRISKITPVIHKSTPKEITRNKIVKPLVKKFTIKRYKKKQKTIEPKKSEENLNALPSPPPSDFDLIRTSVQLTTIDQGKDNKKEQKREIKNLEEYEQYKKEMIEKNNLEKESKDMLIKEISKEEKKISIRNPARINEMHYSLRYRNLDTPIYDEARRFEKIKREDLLNLGEDNLITQLKRMKKVEENRDEEEEEEDDDYDAYSDSVNSRDYEDLDDLDLSEELENKGEVMKKKWMENSPKFKNRILDLSTRRRHAISAANYELFSDLTKSEKISKLSDKVKLLYDKLKQKRKAKKKKRKNNRYFNFEGIDIRNIEEIEKKKKIHLHRLKEDIKYKINEGKYHLIEMENFRHFENAMNRFRLKDSLDHKKVKLYINLVEKYLHFYKVELDNKEREKNDEDRINRFLRNLNHEVYEKIPSLKRIQGRFCHSVDYFQELQKLSELHGFLM